MNTNSSRVDRKLKTKFIASAAACCGMPVRKCVLFCFARSAEWYWFCGFRFNARFHFRHFSCLNASYSDQRNIATLLTVHLCFCGGVWTHSREWQHTQINSRCMHLLKWKMNLLGGDSLAEWNGLHQTNLEEISCFIRVYPWFECILSGVCLGLSEFIHGCLSLQDEIDISNIGYPDIIWLYPALSVFSWNYPCLSIRKAELVYYYSHRSTWSSFY